jgi:hypothetical protein
MQRQSAEARVNAQQSVGRESTEIWCGTHGSSSRLLRRRDHHAGALHLEPGAGIGEQLDLIDGGVGPVHALVAQPRLLAAAQLVEAGAGSCK